MIDVLCEFKIMLNFGGGCGGQWIRLLSWPILVRILSRQCSFYHKGNLEASRFDFAKKLPSLLGEKSMIWTFFLDLHYFSLLLHCNVRNLFNHYYKRSTIVIYDSGFVLAKNCLHHNYRVVIYDHSWEFHFAFSITKLCRSGVKRLFFVVYKTVYDIPGSTIRPRFDPCYRVQVQNQRPEYSLLVQEE